MSKVFCSPITKLAALLVGYVAAFSSVRALSTAFDYYIRREKGTLLKMDLSVSICLFVACTALLLLSVWKSKGRKPTVWRKIDLFVLAVLAYCVVILCVYTAYDMSGYYYRTLILLLLITATAYTAIMALLMEIASRIRDRRLGLHWLQFFKLFPPIRRLIGALTALLLLGNLVYLLAILPNVILQARLNIPLLVLSVFTIATLSYFCTFVLSLSAEYDKANDEKVRAERFKAELITNVSHDIRTPLTSIINYVDLLKALPVEDVIFTEYVDVLERKSARLKTLINDLMEASKAGTGNVAVNPCEVDLTEIVGQIAGEFDDQFAERDLTFVFRQPDEQVLVIADSSHLWRVLENLLGNAAKYALTGTRVFTEIGQRDGKTALSLKNTSQSPIDFPAESLTEQFIRGDRARQTDSNGLGLYIAKSLVELMGGEFTIRASGDLFEVEIVFS